MSVADGMPQRAGIEPVVSARSDVLRSDEDLGEVIFDRGVISSYRADHAAPGLLEPGEPLVLIRARTTAQVQAAVRAAATIGAPIVPRGAGSGLSGGANAIDGCIVLSLEQMTTIVDVDRAAMTATVEPGVINSALREQAAELGLFFAPDPASHDFSTLGGNVATNAGGLCCVKYGVTRDVLLALEVVLADGRAVRLGRRTRKGVVGYDLTSLFCGSEGTLGIITQATFKLLPRPLSAPATMAASFPRTSLAGAAVEQIVAQATPSVLELMDRTTVAAVEALAPQGLDDGVEALVFAQSDAGPGRALEDVERFGAICEAAGATIVVATDEAAEGRMLMTARRLAYTALEAQGATVLDDVVVPLGAIPALLSGVEEIAEQHRLTIGTFGHAGDGNMHPTIVYERGDRGSSERARLAFDAILDLALSLGGTVTGEHGVGLLKLESARSELGPAVELNRSIKRALDPAGLMNPGKGL